VAEAQRRSATPEEELLVISAMEGDPQAVELAQLMAQSLIERHRHDPR
jgi:hypothetical protein